MLPLRGCQHGWRHYIIVTADEAVDTARRLLERSKQDREGIESLGRAAHSALEVHRALMERPVAAAGALVKKTGLTPAAVNGALSRMAQLDIVKELTGKKRNRVFSYRGYIEILIRGMEPPPGPWG